MRLLQDNRSALNEVGTMVISLTKDVARFSEESVRLQEIVVGLTEFLHDYFSGREVRKLKTGLLQRMLGEKQTS